MRRLASFFVLGAVLQGAANPWPGILSAVNLTNVLTPPDVEGLSPEKLAEKVQQGGYAILTGDTPHARHFGFKPVRPASPVRNLMDLRRPNLSILWEAEAQVPFFEVPAQAVLFAQERRTGAPLMAGLKRGTGGVLWLAADPGAGGYERYPYLLQALADLGLQPPVAARSLWAFFDSSYRLRADPAYLAKKWRRNGVSALHVAAWHYFEADEQRDKYLTELIGACHRNAIHVYAWVEFPHVSEKFWNDHPAWREKTASGADAHLDWRKLMNLRNPECRQAASQGLNDLLTRFDWDGVNLAELYFESLEGHANPSRFTPMNDDVRAEFKQAHGFDPAELFRGGAAAPDKLKLFLDYRAQLARQLQQEWVAEVQKLRSKQPHLDLVLTHVDNLLQPDTRDQIGADAKAILPLLDRRDMTLLVEDPATAWNMGPQRYPELAKRYAALTKRMSKVAIDINVVERYQDVYPTKQQTGVELFQELRFAAGAFSRVAVYFESSILSQDWPLLPASMANPTSLKLNGQRAEVASTSGLGLRWQGAAKVNGALWPAGEDGFVWLPAGSYTVEPAPAEPAIKLLDLNASLKSATARPDGIDFAYDCRTRALARLSKPPRKLLIDGAPSEAQIWQFEDDWILVLPKGQHFVSFTVDSVL